MATYTHSDVFFPPYWYEWSWVPPCTGPACDGVIYFYLIPVLNWSSATGWSVQSTSSTTVTLLDLGTTTVLTGSGFTFDEWNNALAGTVTKIERFDGATLLETITDIAIPLVAYQATSIAGALAGDDVVNGGAYGDLLFGYGGNDTFNPGGAAPAFSGQTYDLMVGGPGNDVFNCGADGDAIVAYAFESGGNGVIVNLGTGTATDSYGDSDTLNGITAVVGTSQNDQLIGGNNDETFQPLGGTDTIDGGGGFDVLTYASVDDLLGSYFYGYVGSGITVNLAGAGSGTISSECYGEDTFTGIERVVGTERDDTFNGSTADESFSGGNGNDVLNGGGGNDFLEGGAGFDLLDGGLGDDTAIISASRASVTVTLQGSQVILDGPGGRDVLSNIERIQFADFLLLVPAEVDDPPNDIMVVGGGSLAANEFVGNGTLVGSVVGLDPDSAVFTYSLVDNAGGRFTINAGTGAIAIANGLLLDFEQNPTHVIRVRVEDAAHAAFEKDFTVAVNNVDPETIIGDATANTFVGGALDDDFSGAGGFDVLVGGAGNDDLSGNAGQDALTGGLGRDILSGGTEADAFVFTSAADSVVGSNRGDVITDWETLDIIDLTGIDANTSLIGNQDFTFIGLGAANLNVRQGQLKYYQSGGLAFAAAAFTGSPAWGRAAPREKIVFTSNCVCPLAEAVQRAEIHIMNPNGSQPTRLTNDSFGEALSALSPDGKGKIVFDSNRISIFMGLPLESDLFLINHDGTSDSQTPQMPTFLTRGSSASFDPTGKHIAFHRSASLNPFPYGTRIPGREEPGGPTIDSDIFRLNLDDLVVVNLTNGLSSTPGARGQFASDDADWSPDGKWIAFTSRIPGNPSSAGIYVMNLATNVVTRLTNSGIEERSPAWSPDGKRIAIMKRRNVAPTTFDIWVLRFNPETITVESETQLTDNIFPDLSPAWSPTGDKIVFQSNRGLLTGNAAQIFVIDANGQRCTPGQCSETALTGPPPAPAGALLGTNGGQKWGRIAVGRDPAPGTQ